MNQESADLLHYIRVLQNENKSRQHERIKLSSEINRLTQQNQQLKQSSLMRSKINELQNLLNSESFTNQALNETKQLDKNQIKQLKSKISSLQQYISDLVSHIQQLQDERNYLLSNIQDLKSELQLNNSVIRNNTFYHQNNSNNKMKQKFMIQQNELSKDINYFKKQLQQSIQSEINKPLFELKQEQISYYSHKQNNNNQITLQISKLFVQNDQILGNTQIIKQLLLSVQGQKQQNAILRKQNLQIININKQLILSNQKKLFEQISEMQLRHQHPSEFIKKQQNLKIDNINIPVLSQRQSSNLLIFSPSLANTKSIINKTSRNKQMRIKTEGSRQFLDTSRSKWDQLQSRIQILKEQNQTIKKSLITSK